MRCEYDCGYFKSYEKIYSLKTIALSKTTYTYNGKVRKPTVIIKDRRGKAIPYGNACFYYQEGLTNVGKYKVKVALYGDYDGVKNLYFTINPKNTSITKLTAKKKAFTVKIKKYTTQTTGYQIQYSTNKKFKKAKSVNVSNKTTTKTIKNLKAKTTYYVRLRTYKTLKDGKYYSSFSKTKVIKTK